MRAGTERMPRCVPPRPATRAGSSRCRAAGQGQGQLDALIEGQGLPTSAMTGALRQWGRQAGAKQAAAGEGGSGGGGSGGAQAQRSALGRAGARGHRRCTCSTDTLLCRGSEGRLEDCRRLSSWAWRLRATGLQLKMQGREREC